MPRDDAIAVRVRDAAARVMGAVLPPRIGPWRVLGLVGEGGMGVVLLGERDDGEYQRRVAIKLVRGFVSERVRERFRRERQVLAALDHPNIAGLIDGGTTDAGEPWLVMPFIEGMVLRDWLRATPAPTLRERLALFANLCRAVHYAHQRLVVHRDLKPSNVMVRPDGSPVLLDFGIAKLIDDTEGGETQTRAMTPRYASPEQLLGLPVTTATDVFGLGLLLYELLAGGVPDRGDGARAASTELPSASAAAQAAETGPWRGDAPRLRGDLDRIVHRAVRTDPAARYPSALALAEDVEAWLDGRPVQAAGTHGLYLLRRFVGRHKVAVSAAAAAVIAIGVVSLQWKEERDRALEAEATARREATAAQGVTSFLEGVFSELDPDRHGGREVSGRELLALGRERIPTADTAGAELRARLQASIGRIYASAGETDTAIGLLAEADPVLQRTDDAPARMTARKALANALNLAGRHAEANPVAVALAADALAQDPPDRMMAAHAGTEIGISAEQLGRRDEALAAFDQAEALFRAEGAQGPLGTMLHNRAWLLERSGDYAGALAGYDEAVAQKIAVYGPEHPQVEPSQYGRAKMLSALGRYREAAEVMQGVLGWVGRVSGPRSAPMRFTLLMLGSIHLDLGEYEQAEQFYRRGLEVDREVAGGASSANVAQATNSLAVLLEERGDVAAAEALYREALAMRRELHPPGHANLAGPMQNLARLAMDAGKPRRGGGGLRRGAFDPHHRAGRVAPADARVAAALRQHRCARRPPRAGGRRHRRGRSGARDHGERAAAATAGVAAGAGPVRRSEGRRRRTPAAAARGAGAGGVAASGGPSAPRARATGAGRSRVCRRRRRGGALAAGRSRAGPAWRPRCAQSVDRRARRAVGARVRKHDGRALRRARRRSPRRDAPD